MFHHHQKTEKRGFVDKAKDSIHRLTHKLEDKMAGVDRKSYVSNVSTISTEPALDIGTTEFVAQESIVNPVHGNESFLSNTSQVNDSFVKRQVIQDAPEIHTRVFREDATVVREIIHEVPVIHKEIHERVVLQKDIIREVPIIEKEIHEIPIHVTEVVKHGVEIRGNLPGQFALQREVVVDAPILTESRIKDEAVLGRIVEHEKPIIHKQIVEMPVINKEIIHERPIIEREVREIPMFQKEVIRDDVILQGNIPTMGAAVKEVVREAAITSTEVIREQPVLRSELIHEKPVITKEIYEKPVITKEIIHEKPLIEKHLIETTANQVETLRLDAVVEERAFVEKPVYETFVSEMGAGLAKANLSANASNRQLVWLDKDRFELQNGGIFRRFFEKFHGPRDRLHYNKVYILDQGTLAPFDRKLHSWDRINPENVFILE